MRWTKEAIAAALEEIGKSTTLYEAAAGFSSRMGESVSLDAMRMALRAAGISAPAERLASANVLKALGAPPAVATFGPGHVLMTYGGAPPPDLDDDETARVEPRDTEPAPDRQFVDPVPDAAKRWSMPATGSSRWLFVPDCHIPYQDTLAYRCMVNAARELRPDGIVIIGDYADCYAVSFHEKDPARSGRLADEMAAVNECLDGLDALGATSKVYCSGNHEARLDRYIADKAKALYGLVTLRELLKLDERGWRHVPYLATYAIGDALFTHTITKYGGVNAHRQTRDAFNSSCVVGHTHRLSWETRGDFSGAVRVGMSIGCLLSFDLLDYEHKAKAARDWAHGFGVGTLDHETGHMHLVPIEVTRGRCVVDGKVVTA